ncbi:MAG TPA: Hsp20/alpha crystallin family protein [Candidatus Saccharimonadia bacterium]|nr:Hsp20/alpha crystallin family protein [Candidatus Saccharimonadia bacterium]
MAIVRYTPWSVNPALHNEIRTVFDRFLQDGEGDQSNVVTSEWTPRVDVREEAGQFVIEADVPGVDPKDIEIHMENGVLSIRGERKSGMRPENAGYTRVERAHGTFYRRFALPDTANPEGITAKGSHGVLEIAIPKRPEVKARRINVNA